MRISNNLFNGTYERIGNQIELTGTIHSDIKHKGQIIYWASNFSPDNIPYQNIKIAFDNSENIGVISINEYNQFFLFPIFYLIKCKLPYHGF